MYAKLALMAAAAAIVVALVVVVSGGEEGENAGNPESEISLEEATAPLEGAPPELAAIREQGNELLGGGLEAMDERLAELRGAPVVINAWASWCGPCRAEFPHFQSAAIELGDEVAFLGIDAADGEDAAATFLEQLPLPYPSYVDPDRKAERELLNNPTGFPSTGFYDSKGELVYVQQGPYESEDALLADIERYAQ